MKAIILVAGYATRLYPLTKNMPKALLTVCGKTIMDYIVDEINTISIIDEIFVISNAVFYDQFKNWELTANTTNKITVINDGTTNNDNRLGAIGDINLTIETGKIDDDILIIAGDTLFNFPLKDFSTFFEKLQKDCVCGKEFFDKDELKRFGVATLDENNKIIDIEEKPTEPKSNIVVYATYIYKKETVPLFKKYLDEGNNPDAPGHFLVWLIKQKDVLTYKFNGDCIDVGTIDAYNSIKDSFSK